MQTPNEKKNSKNFETNKNINKNFILDNITPLTFNSISFLNDSNSFKNFGSFNKLSYTPFNLEKNKENVYK